ncbi:inactive N-acetylated-alpha-linked acidic dipeptidase-like protein 2 [Eucyclogobius newberryi]|uniref:inactive N-acetylated-alpha-linked acidic dipeptidase-like protein 2 n=1 Tax=Eucyclogobius newberryi TaxID=166745 RepID=UPI003B5AD7B8
MAYRKVCDSQGGPLVGEVCRGALELDWDLDKEELPEAVPDLERLQMQHVDCPRADPGPDPDPEFMEPIPPSVSVSPHGRFERLQEDPNYISHFTRAPGNKGQRRLQCFLLRYFVAGVALFVLGLLIGWFIHSPASVKAKALPPESSDLLEELLTRITAEKIEALQRSISSQSDSSEEARARYLHRQWVGLGLTDVQLSNRTALMSLPGPTPNTITDHSSLRCFLPTGESCDQSRANTEPSNHQYSYAAYSAVGTLQGEVVDVQYGSLEDLRRVRLNRNLTNQIAVMKLGRAPLLYKLSLLSELGFGGALLYVDPCDAPQGQTMWSQAFSVTLNPGGNPARVGVSKEAKGSLSSLLVQPISPVLAQTLLSAPITERAEACTPLATPPNAEPRMITLSVGNQWVYKKIYNVIGYLKGKKNPDRYVLVGSHHDAQQGGGASAILTELIAAFSDQTKKGWVPNRTTVFCSWGGSALGHIGSYEWGKENHVVLQSSAVAYVSLDCPVRGTETLRASASPALLQLTSDIQRRQLLSCIRGGNCPGPNVSSPQMPGDSSFFSNLLAVPTLEFSFQQTSADEASSLLSEAQFSMDSPQTLDPLFKFHETITKMTAEAILRLVNDPVLPVFTLDIVLDIQNKLRDKRSVPPPLLSAASSLRDHAAFFQSEVMRPANDPKERDPAHVRMLNDVLRDVEKSFILPHAPPGVYRNLLYSLPGSPPQFSILRFSEDAILFCNNASHIGTQSANQEVTGPLSHDQEVLGPRTPDVSCLSSRDRALDLILAAVRSADRLICFGQELFENYPSERK